MSSSHKFRSSSGGSSSGGSSSSGSGGSISSSNGSGGSSSSGAGGVPGAHPASYVPLSAHCSYDYMDFALALTYLLLLVWCLVLIWEHHSSWRYRQVNGLLWYLVCSAILCLFRAMALGVLPFAQLTCDANHKAWQWETDGLASGALSASASSSSDPSAGRYFSLILLLLSTASMGLFFTSYTYFAHSLAKVLDMLTVDASYGGDTRFLVLLLGLNICLWLSIGALWVSALLSLDALAYFDSLAQMTVSFAALTTSLAFSLLFGRAACYLCRHDRDVGKAAQLHRLLRLRRVRGVCRVCTVVFFVRAVMLLLRSHYSLSPVYEAGYFVLVEAVPTAYMILAFRSSSTGADGGSRGPKDVAAGNEFEVLKATLTSNITVVSSPARTGFTSRYYATPEKHSDSSQQDLEERSRLLHTPGSDVSSVLSTLDALEMERSSFYHL